MRAKENIEDLIAEKEMQEKALSSRPRQSLPPSETLKCGTVAAAPLFYSFLNGRGEERRLSVRASATANLRSFVKEMQNYECQAACH